MEFSFYILIAIIIALILSLVRLANVEVMLVADSISWCIIVFGLILGFSISNFYNRYIEIRNTFILEVTNMQLIYEMFNQLPNSQPVLLSIEKYVVSFIDRSSNIEEDYLKMDKEIIKYIQNNPTNPFTNNILLRMSTYQKIKTLTKEITIGNYYIDVLWFLLILIIIPLFFMKFSNRGIQFIVDSCLLVIFFTGMYLCDILNNPFNESPVMIKFDSYKDFINQIRNTKDPLNNQF